MTNYLSWLTNIHVNFAFLLYQNLIVLKMPIYYIGAEDVHKNLETLAYVWKELGDKGASRHSLLINLGGGWLQI